MSLASVPANDTPRVSERILPNDLAAEQSTLGGMLLSQEAVAEVHEIVRGIDFYAPKHEAISSTSLVAVNQRTSSRSPKSSPSRAVWCALAVPTTCTS